MNAQTKLISDYIDGNLSDKESAEFLLQIRKNNSLKNEFILIRDLNSYMKGKLFSKDIETNPNFSFIEAEARDDVNTFLQEGKTDKEISDYLSVAFPDRSEAVKSQIKQAEYEAELFEINDLTEKWVNELYSEQEHNSNDIPNKTNYFSETVNIFRKENLKYIAIAASLALLLILNNVFVDKPTNERIFAEYHQSAQKLTGIQIRNPEFNTIIKFENAVKLFNSGQYSKAYDKFHQTAIENKNFVQALYYSGLALFESGKYSESVLVFNNVLTKFDIYHFEAEWYLSLAYIKLNQPQNAVPFLKDIASQKNSRHNEAGEILDKIK
ncbi:MAG: hypothetical protein GXO80_09905 [Chlorobi bacterium]|nr:hypothetical protein [Chlorobiota bacterium]